MGMIRSICVYCGSSPGTDPVFVEVANAFGQILAEKGITLVYGGGSRGLMGALARSVEYFRIPRNVVTITVGKSTYARCGIITNVTPFEPEWEGFVTLEISNTTPLPAKIYANEGIAQVLFFKGEEEPMVSYKDKKGKYQGQQGVTLPRL